MFYKKIPLLLFFVPLFAFSERIKFSLDTETGEEETVVTVPLEWNEKWISGGTSETYNHELARVACVLSDSAYCDVEGTTRSLVSNYVSLGVKKSDIELHYDINYDAPIIGNNQAAHSFANVHLKNGKDLVFIVIRGTTRNANEWISNINISDTSRTAQEIHEGFYYTELEIHKELIYYLLTHKLSPENTSFLITGHSRGGAVANLLGQHMSDEGYFSKENIYVYTFAAPNIASKKNYEGRDYNFIWNIVNPEDVVPTVPPCREGWDYNKPGHMLSLCSYWTVTPGLYEKEYLPKINSWFNKFCARDYYPFKIGTFIPSIITRGLTGFYETVDGYYASRLRVSKKIEGLFWKLFPAKGKELDVDEESGSASRLFDKLAATFNEQTNGLLDYSAFAFSDMHSCKTYLSFMLSFDEKTVFSDLGSSQIVLRGNYDCAVFNSKGDVVVRVLDGILQFSSIRVPVGAMYVPGVTVIGLPANDDFTVVISNDSLLPTIISVAVEHYDSASYLVESFHRINMYPHRGMVYTFSAGKITLSQSEVNDKKIRSKPARRLADAGGLNPGDVFRIQPEINFNSDFNFGYGMRFGTRKLYAGFLLGHSVTDLGQSVDLSLGGGHQESLYGGIMFDMEAYSKITCALSKPEEVSRFNLVPELRLSLVYKPFHRVQFFAGGVFDFKIKDFNTGAFVSDVRSKNLGTIEINDKVSIVPSINVGLRF